MQHFVLSKSKAKIKKEAVKKAKGDGEVYRNYKKKFIQNVLKKALSERK